MATSMTGHQLPIIGEMTVTIQIGNYCLTGPIVFVEEISYDLVTGTKMMKQMGKIVLDFGTRALHVFNVNIVMNQPSQSPAMRLVNSVNTPACSTIIVTAACLNLLLPTTMSRQLYITEVSKTFVTEHPSTKIVSSLVQPIDHQVPIKIADSGLQPVDLKNGSMVGKLHPVDPSELYLLWSETSNYVNNITCRKLV